MPYTFNVKNTLCVPAWRWSAQLSQLILLSTATNFHSLLGEATPPRPYLILLYRYILAIGVWEKREREKKGRTYFIFKFMNDVLNSTYQTETRKKE